MPKKETIAVLKKRLTRYFNKWIKMRDGSYYDDGSSVACISCGAIKAINDAGMHAGHYVNSTHTCLRFCEYNVHAQCNTCNLFQRGNLISYREGLCIKITEDKVKHLELNRHNQIKLSKFWYKEMIDHYKSLVKSNPNKYGIVCFEEACRCPVCDPDRIS